MVFIKAGTTGTLYASFVDLDGNPHIPSDARITIKYVDDGANITLIDEAAMTQIGATNEFFYDWEVALSAYIGNYLVTYEATIDGFNSSTSETIQVIKGDTPADERDNYTTPLQIAQVAGIAVEVPLEKVGTGDGIIDSYDTKNGAIFKDSYTVMFGDSDSNNFTDLVEEDDYFLDKEKGAILLTSAGRTKVNEKDIYISYTHGPKQSSKVIESYLNSIDDEVDKVTSDYWGTLKASTVYFDGYDSGYPQTDQPFGNRIENSPEYMLPFSGVRSVESVQFLDKSGEVVRTLEDSEIRFWQDGRLVLNTTVPNGQGNVKVVFGHGYDFVPALIQELAALHGGMKALINISGGSYRDVSTYSLGRKSFSIGQVYVNIQSSIDQMKTRIDEIRHMFGSNYGVA